MSGGWKAGQAVNIVTWPNGLKEWRRAEIERVTAGGVAYVWGELMHIPFGPPVRFYLRFRRDGSEIAGKARIEPIPGASST